MLSGDEFYGDDVTSGIEVKVRLNAMRCQVCGHRLDDMDGCDSCAADREAALVDGLTEEGDDCG